jgi:hypothetical protein
VHHVHTFAKGALGVGDVRTLVLAEISTQHHNLGKYMGPEKYI